MIPSFVLLFSKKQTNPPPKKNHTHTQHRTFCLCTRDAHTLDDVMRADLCNLFIHTNAGVICPDILLPSFASDV